MAKMPAETEISPRKSDWRRLVVAGFWGADDISLSKELLPGLASTWRQDDGTVILGCSDGTEAKVDGSECHAAILFPTAVFFEPVASYRIYRIEN